MTNPTDSPHDRSSIPAVQQSLLPLDLSRPPSNEEIMAAGQLGGQLYPTHIIEDAKREAEVNLSFGKAIQEWNKHEYKLAVKLFNEHVSQYPDSPWVAEAQLHMGCDAQYTGRYSEADKLFSTIIDTYSKNESDGPQKMVNKAQLRMGVLKTFQNNLPEAEKQFTTLMQQSDNWRDKTYASHWLQRLSNYNSNKLAMLNCGTLALAHLLDKDGKEVLARSVREIIPTSMSGHSLEDIREIASSYGYNLAGFRISPESLGNIPLPAIVQIQAQDQGDSGHYWVLEKVEGGRVDLFDAQAGRIFSQTIDEFSNEWRGEILIFQNQKFALSLGQKLSEHELNETFGGCCGVPRAPSNLGSPGNNSGGTSGGGPCGAPVWSVNVVNMNLYVHDVPLWFSSPIGPSVEISLSYNSQSSIAYNEPFGNKWQFNYGSYLVVDTGGQVTIFMPDGKHDIYSPDGAGGYRAPSGVFNNLTKIAENHFILTFLDGTAYEYDIPSGTASLQPFIVKITDRYGKSLNFGYDTNVRLVSITDALNRQTTLDYNTSGLVTRVTDPFGRFAAFEYSGSKLIKITDMGGYASNLTYDQDVYITSIGNSRGTWQFYIEPASAASNGSNPYPPPGGAMWANYRITITDPSGQKEEYHYNGYSRYGWHVSPNYYKPYVDGSHNNFTDPSVKKTRYNFTMVNGQGVLSSITFPDGASESYEYDATTGQRNKTTDSHGDITSFQLNTKGLVQAVTNPRSITTTLSYGANDIDLVGVTNGLGTIAMTYDAFHKVTSITNRRGKKSTLTYNALGQLTSSEDPLGNVTNYSYYSATDANKYRLKEVTRNAKVLVGLNYDASGRVIGRTDATGLTMAYGYDGLDRVTAITYPDGKQDLYSYSSCCPKLLDSFTDRTGRTTSYTYDEMQRLVELRNPDSTIIRYSYDPNGNLVKLADSNGNSTVFSYDSMNRLVKKTYADGKEEVYTYDNAGLLLTRTGARGIKASYSYDANHNLTGITYSDGTPSVGYTYDNYDRVISRIDGAGTHGYTYDVDSRLTILDGPWENDSISYSYDDADRLVKLQQQGAEEIAYSYDSFSRLTAIGVGTRQFTYGYPTVNASPIPLNLSRPNGSVTTFQQDLLNRLTGLATKNSSQQLILSNSFTYDSKDQRGTEVVTNGLSSPALSDRLVTYDYNKVNQLISSTNPGKTYSYDADGNMTKGYTPDGYQFSATYDGENRLKTVTYTDSASVVHNSAFEYNANDFLTSQIVDGVSKRFVRTGYTLLQERDSANTVTRAPVWDPQAPGGIGGLLELNQSGQRYYPFYDGKSNVTGLLDANQNVVANYTYDPFGLPVAKSGTVEQPYRFSTKMYDEKTGLSYYGYRFYSPILGRWINRDPMGENGGINLYDYSNGNPVNFIDPDGRIPIFIPIILTGGTISGIFDAYDAWNKGQSFGCIAKSFGVGFASGAVGTTTGLVVGLATANPFLVGASGGLTSSLAKEGLNGWNDDSAGKVFIGTAGGALTGPLAGKIPGLRTVGRQPNIWAERTLGEYGKNSNRLIGQEAAGGVMGTAFGNVTESVFGMK